jgi:AraC-like DNA-binding protein
LANGLFDEVMVNKIEEERILNFLRTALMNQKDVKQYLHFKPKLPEDSRIEELLITLLTELECNDEASKFICKGILIRMLHHISTNYEFFLSNEERKKMNWIVFEEINHYITDNYAAVTIRDLMQRFHFNEDYYNRILKEKTGLTYSEYVQNIRLLQSEKLLRTTSLTIDEIAGQVGYNNKGYFYKIFVDRFGMTPSKYRKQIGNVGLAK